MSLRLLTTRLANHGRNFLRSYWRRQIHTNISEQNQTNRRIPSSVVRSGAFSTPTNAASLPFRSGILRFGQHARKLFIDNILNRCTTPYSEELRKRATKKLFYGDSVPFFALIGVSLASGAGVLTKEDELEGVCWEIREAAGRLQASWNHDEISGKLHEDCMNIDKLEIGPPIAKGCAAVVYAAAFKKSESKNDDSMPETSNIAVELSPHQTRFSLQQNSFRPEMMSPIQNMSRFVHNFGSSVDNLNIYNQQASTATRFADEHSPQQTPTNPTNLVCSQQISKHKTGFTETNQQKSQIAMDTDVNSDRYPLALKMMFNYDIQSNALSILRAMYKETIPARQRHRTEVSDEWERLLQDQTLTLVPHPNVVCMYGFFCDEVRNFPDGHLLYPIAQPQRINPHGYGRNMSLYLLMKRYDYSLRKLLDTYELSTRTRLLLFTQLLEAVAHINCHSVAHRDIKSDNILIENSDDNTTPILVLSDFGCCLADKVHGLQVPYTSFDIDKGGNAALMAPEIINKQPGPFSVLNYARADLWACGAIAYEIFGLQNPFYSSSGGLTPNKSETFSLRNTDYKESDLPPLCSECPHLVQKLIHNILNPNPSKRVSPDIAANIMQLFLWAPSNWLKEGGMPNSPEILQWLLSLTTKVMCEGRPSATSPPLQAQQLSFSHSGCRTYVEYLLICSFLARVRLRRVRGALYWIQNMI